MSKIRRGAITPIISKRKAKNLYRLGDAGHIEKICERRGGVFYILSSDRRMSGGAVETIAIDVCPESILQRVDKDVIRLGGDIIYEMVTMNKERIGFVFCRENSPGCILCTVYLLENGGQSAADVFTQNETLLYIPFPCYDRKCYSKNGDLVCETSVEGQRVGQNARFSEGIEKLERCEKSLMELSDEIRYIMARAREQASAIGEQADSEDGKERCSALSAGSVLSEEVYTAGQIADILNKAGDSLKNFSAMFGH